MFACFFQDDYRAKDIGGAESFEGVEDTGAVTFAAGRGNCDLGNSRKSAYEELVDCLRLSGRNEGTGGLGGASAEERVGTWGWRERVIGRFPHLL